MGLFSSIKKLFSKRSKVEVKPITIITNRGIGDEKDTTISVDTGIQTTFNSDGIDILVEEGEVENVSN